MLHFFTPERKKRKFWSNKDFMNEIFLFEAQQKNPIKNYLSKGNFNALGADKNIFTIN